VRGENQLYAYDLQQLVIEDLKVKRLKVDGMLRPTYSFREAEKAVEVISMHPEDVIKVAIKY
jgi:threonine dehydrogenase-like Zn-dependent dehydrogenase